MRCVTTFNHAETHTAMPAEDVGCGHSISLPTPVPVTPVCSNQVETDWQSTWPTANSAVAFFFCTITVAFFSSLVSLVWVF